MNWKILVDRKKIDDLLALSAYQWYLLIAALLLLPLIGLSLRLFGFKKTYNHAIPQDKKSTIQSNPSDAKLQKAQVIARMIDIAAAHGFYKANCLSRSLLLLRALKKRDIPCQLMIGVNNDGNISKIDLSAHAWVESRNVVLNDKADVALRFKAFPLLKDSLQ